MRICKNLLKFTWRLNHGSHNRDSGFQYVVFLRVWNQNVFTRQSSLLKDQTNDGVIIVI